MDYTQTRSAAPGLGRRGDGVGQFLSPMTPCSRVHTSMDSRVPPRRHFCVPQDEVPPVVGVPLTRGLRARTQTHGDANGCHEFFMSEALQRETLQRGCTATARGPPGRPLGLGNGW